MQNATIAEPLIQATEADIQSCAANSQTGKANSPLVPRVLSIDDDPDISRCIELRLREYQVEVSRAYFGMQGFWEAITGQPDLIITDVSMPSGDGRFVLESLRRNRNTEAIPVIVLTGMKDRELRDELLALGSDQFLTKPIDFDELFHEISRFVDLQSRPGEPIGA